MHTHKITHAQCLNQDLKTRVYQPPETLPPRDAPQLDRVRLRRDSLSQILHLGAVEQAHLLPVLRARAQSRIGRHGDRERRRLQDDVDRVASGYAVNRPFLRASEAPNVTADPILG